jgi:hypothetical protein
LIGKGKHHIEIEERDKEGAKNEELREEKDGTADNNLFKERKKRLPKLPKPLVTTKYKLMKDGSCPAAGYSCQGNISGKIFSYKSPWGEKDIQYFTGCQYHTKEYLTSVSSGVYKFVDDLGEVTPETPETTERFSASATIEIFSDMSTIIKVKMGDKAKIFDSQLPKENKTEILELMTSHHKGFGERIPLKKGMVTYNWYLTHDIQPWCTKFNIDFGKDFKKMKVNKHE